MSNENSCKNIKIEITGGFLLLVAGLYIFMGRVGFGAVFAAVLAHELGHLAALAALGAGVECLRFEFSGLCIVSGGLCRCGDVCLCRGKRRLYTAAAALAGPAAGLVLAAMTTGQTRQVSLALSLFNLLPYSKLDGGRFLRCVLPGRGFVSAAADCGVIFALLAAGLKNPRAGAAGFWLAVDFMRSLL